jgi:maltose-binding protein MalE
MKTPTLSKEELKEAISEGVYQAFWQMITHATGMPCHDFYDAVGDAVERAMREAADKVVRGKE